MQRNLMERVLGILLEVENLTSHERTRVQDGLTFIRSDETRTLTQHDQMRYACGLFLMAAQTDCP